MKRTFPHILLIFWALWWSIAFLTDFLGALGHLQLIHTTLLVNENYPALVKVLQMYHAPQWLPGLLFAGIILWSFLSCFYFWWATFAPRQAHAAFIISLTLWLAFFLADQLIFNYALEQNHMVQGGFQLLCYLVFLTFSNSAASDGDFSR